MDWTELKEIFKSAIRSKRSHVQRRSIEIDLPQIMRGGARSVAGSPEIIIDGEKFLKYLGVVIFRCCPGFPKVLLVAGNAWVISILNGLGFLSLKWRDTANLL
jgi:hypothetical protein